VAVPLSRLLLRDVDDDDETSGGDSYDNDELRRQPAPPTTTRRRRRPGAAPPDLGFHLGFSFFLIYFIFVFPCGPHKAPARENPIFACRCSISHAKILFDRTEKSFFSSVFTVT
jgi:hypothetical protein